jgi:hypothetical protein
LRPQIAARRREFARVLPMAEASIIDREQRESDNVKTGPLELPDSVDVASGKRIAPTVG